MQGPRSIADRGQRPAEVNRAYAVSRNKVIEDYLWIGCRLVRTSADLREPGACFDRDRQLDWASSYILSGVIRSRAGKNKGQHGLTALLGRVLTHLMNSTRSERDAREPCRRTISGFLLLKIDFYNVVACVLFRLIGQQPFESTATLSHAGSMICPENSKNYLRSGA